MRARKWKALVPPMTDPVGSPNKGMLPRFLGKKINLLDILAFVIKPQLCAPSSPPGPGSSIYSLFSSGHLIWQARNFHILYVCAVKRTEHNLQMVMFHCNYCKDAMRLIVCR